MANGRIKGITIEIDGSTTGLDKALKSTESNISSVQRSLKDVNRLLKIDPSNTELLSQKQKLLGQAVDDTKKKLESLKTASEQAAKTVGNYDAWKEAYTPIQEEINKTKDHTKKLKEAMEELEKAGKVDTSEYQDLQKELQSNEDHLKDLKKQAKEVSDEFGNPISHEQYDNLQREIIDTENQLKSLEKQAKDTGSILGKHLQQAGEKMQAVGGKISDVGGKMSTHVSLPIAAAGVAIGKMSMDFEDSMAKVSTIADETEVPIGDMKQAIIDLSNQTGVSATDIADNVYNAISAGQKTGDAVNFVSNATKLARAGFAETGDALDILTTVMNAYGMEADDVNRVSDVLIQTQNLGKTTVAELSGAMGKVIPTAKAQNVQLEELAGAYAVMTSNGIATAETTTYMNSMLNELGKQGTTAADAFAKGTEHIKEGGLTMAEAMEQGWSLTDVLGILDEQAAESGTSIANMFGSAEAGKAASVLWDNANKLNDAVEQMGNSSGATEEAFGKLETKSYTVEKAVKQLENSATGFGDTVMQMSGPIIEKVAAKIEELTAWLNGLDEDQKEMVVTIAAVVAAVGPVLFIIGKVISTIGVITAGIGSLISFFGGLSGAAGAAGAGITLFSGPLLPIIGIIAGVVTAGVLLYKNWDTIKEKAQEVSQKASEKWGELKESALEKWENMKSGAQEKWDGIESTVTEKVESAKNKAAEGWNELNSRTDQAWSNIQTSVQNNGGGIKGIIATAISGYQNIWSVGFSAIDSITGGKLGNALSTVQSKMESIRTAFSNKINAAKDAVHDAIENIKSKFNFTWKLPSLKLPHISVEGSFSLSPPSVPKFGISWYKKAMDNAYLLNGATIFGGMNGKLLGGGEAGSEMVVGQQYLTEMIQHANAQSNAEVIKAINNMSNKTAAIMNKYLPDCAKQKVAIPERALSRSLRDMGVAFE